MHSIVIKITQNEEINIVDTSSALDVNHDHGSANMMLDALGYPGIWTDDLKRVPGRD